MTARRHLRNATAQLLQFEATDGVSLPGLLYEPDAGTKSVAIFLHGNGDSSIFYSDRVNVMAAEMNRRGLAFFPFNNRGAHLIRQLNRREGRQRDTVELGMTYELIRDCRQDINGAIRFLRKRGFEQFHLIGHSTGANKIVVYNYLSKRSAVSSYVLLAGGDDTGLYYESLGARRFREALRKCRERIGKGEGTSLVTTGNYSPFLISWQSLFDTINPDGDYNIFPFYEAINGLQLSRKKHFRELRVITRPTLLFYGSEDEYCFGDVSRCVAILEEALSGKPNFEFVTLRGADHSFHGKVRQMAAMIASWIAAQ
ncbi:MAG TPA: alpha/beta fold hydrolase [Thermoanaerobaculia bacterium]|nr:alpha/beta fold hydrolase [Thermoanaerobaculia bacterium]